MPLPVHWGRLGRAAAGGLRLVAGRVSGRPALVSAVVYLTQRCNLRCVYCSAPFRGTGELDTATWRGIVDELAALGCVRVAILGGEPLLRPDLGELIAHIGDRGMTASLTSNGLLVPRRLDALRRLSHLVLSLDAPGPANDAARGEGVFEAVQAALAAARGIGLRVKLNAVLTAHTAGELDALLAFCDRHDLPLTVNVVRSEAPDLWRDAATVRPADDAIAGLLEHLAVQARRNPRLLFSPSTYRYAADWQAFGKDRSERGDWPAGDRRLRRAPSCHHGRNTISIDADGEVYPCAITVGRIRGGNAAREGVRATWRRLHDHQCLTCFSPCTVEQNAILSLRPGPLLHFARRHLGRFA
jgi:MoaA/NifB/PqqE/SkfB family radical SAM enzyme